MGFLILGFIYLIFCGDEDSSSRKAKKSYDRSYTRKRRNTYWEQQEKFRNDLGYHQWLGYQ